MNRRGRAIPHGRAATGPAGALFALGATIATAGSVDLPGPGGMMLNVPVASFQEQKFEQVVPQAFDFSCGSAAVATLLTYHFEQPRSERDIFIDMYEKGDQENIRAKGFSLLDMKLYLERQGYRADGFRISLDKLAEVGVPAIALIDTNGYSHFIVIKAVDDGHVIVGDPALGVRGLEREEFERIWNGILFVIHNRADIARRHFNQKADWERMVDPPLAQALSRRSLAELTMSLSSRPHDY